MQNKDSDMDELSNERAEGHCTKVARDDLQRTKERDMENEG